MFSADDGADLLTTHRHRQMCIYMTCCGRAVCLDLLNEYIIIIIIIIIITETNGRTLMTGSW